MAKITVRSGTQTRTLQGAQGETLLRLLTRHGVFLPARCGGRGTCKKCRVKLLSGSVEGASPDEEGFILACRARIAGDCTIEAESEYRDTLSSLYTQYRDELTMCDPAEFDALYDQRAQEYLDAGYQAIIDERLAAYEAGQTTKLAE